MVIINHFFFLFLSLEDLDPFLGFSISIFVSSLSFSKLILVTSLSLTATLSAPPFFPFFSLCSSSSSSASSSSPSSSSASSSYLDCFFPDDSCSASAPSSSPSTSGWCYFCCLPLANRDGPPGPVARLSAEASSTFMLGCWGA
jgi:hypothetical protein